MQVNGKKLLGLNHVDVVSILKDLPQHVRIVCCREKPKAQSDFSYAQTRDQFFQTPNSTAAPASYKGSVGSTPASMNESGASGAMVQTPYSGASVASYGLTESTSASPLTPGSISYQQQQSSERLVKAKSEQSLPVSTATPSFDQNMKNKSRSLEPLTGLAMWSAELVEVDLQKGDRGLGFSILDYQVCFSNSL